MIVNGLDDGASTGAIREMFGDNSHGISDFLKVAVAMSPNGELVSFLNERFPVLTSSNDQLIFSIIFIIFCFLTLISLFLKKKY